MTSYKLEIKTIIFSVGVLSIVIFSFVLGAFDMVKFDHIGELLLHYGLLIAPITLLWVWLDKALWHSRPLQAVRKSLNLPPDLRGRWEGELNSSQSATPQKFVIEVKQSLTSLHVYSYSSAGHSHSVLVDIATDESEDQFVLCFLWLGEVPIMIEGKKLIQKFHGYTLLTLNEREKPKKLSGTYFTDHLPNQTHGTIELQWVSSERKRSL